ncbi:spike base protein, RCAP_Rcc01079 family [Roseobacter weihaiensis]|uniref:spike base protein, RCAP_Rcc01079 family n=1 Tax=Roseobacter weihaiensis TaxID=2763262 RepID=UPI001D0A07EC|nr:hypothetical protein [Roseobacter sp. H9]
MPKNKFNGSQTGSTGPLTELEEITPSDSADLQTVTRALNVATTGTVFVTTLDGQTGAITIAAGIPFPLRATRVWSTGTTATGIVGLS